MSLSNRLMMLVAAVCLGGGWATGATTPTPAPAAAPLPTSADVRQQFTDGKFADAIRSVSKITTSREWQAKKFEGYELYTIKGESHLHLKESALAISSFDLAAKAAAEQVAIDKAAADKASADNNKVAEEAATAKLRTDHAQAGLARATAYLIKHSTGTFYVPKATANQRVQGGTPEDHIKIDIVNPDTRKQALTAIWTDQKNASAAKFTAASDMDNKSMGVVMEASADVPNLRDFDFAANGNDEDTQKVVTAVGSHGRDLLQDMLDKMITKLDVISSDAYSVQMMRQQLPGGGYSDRWRKHGLEGKQPQDLQEMLTNVGKISTALKLLQDQLIPEDGFFEKAIKDAKRVHEQADKLLKTDYSESYVTKKAAEKS